MSIPDFLVDKLNSVYGNEVSKEIIDGFSSQRKITLRVNNLKTNKAEVENELSKNGIIFSEVPWFDNALIIENFKNQSIKNFKVDKFNESNFFENEIKKLDIYNEGKIYFL